MSTTNKPTPERKAALSNICDAENYLPIVSECLSDDQKKVLRPAHMANVMALTAELFLGNYDGIAAAFERQSSLEIAIKVKLASEKDAVELSFKPVEVFKDSASANLPDEDQATFDFNKPKPQTQPEPEGEIVEAEVIHALPAPMLGLPAPAEGSRTTAEQAAFEQGWKYNFDPNLDRYSECPFPLGTPESNAFLQGWKFAETAEKILNEKASMMILEEVEEATFPFEFMEILNIALVFETTGKARKSVIARLKQEIQREQEAADQESPSDDEPESEEPDPSKDTATDGESEVI